MSVFLLKRSSAKSRLGATRLSIGVLANLLIASPAAAQTCRPDTLAAVVNDHAADAPYLLVTTSGRWLRVYGQDFIDPRSWHRREPLAVCPGADSTSLRVRDVRRREDLITENDRVVVGAGPIQIMNGPGFRALLARVAVQCPESRVRFATPATLLDVQDMFQATLDRDALRRFNAAAQKTRDGEFPACAARDGASCPANATMDALMKAELIKRFAIPVCAHGSASWG